MAEEKSSGLSKHFNLKSFFKHLVSPTMVIMMMVMAFPAVAAAAPAAGATLPDMGVALLDHYWQMFSNPFTDGGVVVDAIGNTINGNFDLSYEFGSGHGAHGGATHAAVGAAGHTGHGVGALTPDFGPATEHLGHGNHGALPETSGAEGALSSIATTSLSDALAGMGVELSPVDLSWLESVPLDPGLKAELAQRADYFGKPLQDFVSGWCAQEGIALPNSSLLTPGL